MASLVAGAAALKAAATAVVEPEQKQLHKQLSKEDLVGYIASGCKPREKWGYVRNACWGFGWGSIASSSEQDLHIQCQVVWQCPSRIQGSCLLIVDSLDDLMHVSIADLLA